ncbi:MAG: glycosyltransferase family 2 protein [Oscillospiraceae bacterium]|nr:glycosyltransferase family 2 protein [Oscillospiraceae bacterium]
MNENEQQKDEERAEPCVLYFVIPCYNEEEVLPETARRLRAKLRFLTAKGDVSKSSRILFVDDGSTDGTWNIIKNLHDGDPMFEGLKLSRNRGHQTAVLAGIEEIRKSADAVISLDADLQDDINAADDMIKMYCSGCDIVYGVRAKRSYDSFFKRFTAEGYYKLLAAMGVECVFNHADYRLMSRRAADALAEYGEVNLFLRGIVPTLGFSTGVVEYDRSLRFAGESKYPFKKMLGLAWDGISSFSAKPLRAVTVTGAALVIVSLIMLLVLIVLLISSSPAAKGILLPILTALFFTGGLTVTSVGIAGEYLGKIYAEVKHRPRYFVETVLRGSFNKEEEAGDTEQEKDR